jgi:hypothetical protein
VLSARSSLVNQPPVLLVQLWFELAGRIHHWQDESFCSLDGRPFFRLSVVARAGGRLRKSAMLTTMTCGKTRLTNYCSPPPGDSDYPYLSDGVGLSWHSICLS